MTIKSNDIFMLAKLKPVLGWGIFLWFLITGLSVLVIYFQSFSPLLNTFSSLSNLSLLLAISIVPIRDVASLKPVIKNT